MTDQERVEAMPLQARWPGTAVNDVISHWARNITAYSEAVARPDQPETIVFGGGIPDLATLPADGLVAAARRVLKKDCAGALRYGFGAGDPMMRA